MLQILSTKHYAKPVNIGEYVTRNFVSDNFVKILMMNEKTMSFIKAKQLFINTLKNGSRITDNKTHDIFKCLTHSIYPLICRDELMDITFKTITTWGDLKRCVINTYVLFHD